MTKSIISSLLLFTQFIYGAQMPKSIDYYSEKGVEVEFIALQDPLHIKLKLPNGKTIYVEHLYNDFETLYALQDEYRKSGRKLIVLLKYTNQDGVQVYIPQLKKHFKIIGSMEEHPIDIALEECTSEFYSTYGMEMCVRLSIDAWDAELNRAYKSLGGSKNTSLKKAQVAWMKYRDAQTEALVNEYVDREGTIWRIFLIDEIANLTKTQANLLKSMNSKSL